MAYASDCSTGGSPQALRLCRRAAVGFRPYRSRVDLAVRDREHVARIRAMHAGMTLEILFRGGILLLHLLVEFLKDLNMFLGILDIRRDLQSAEDQAVFGAFADCDIGSPVSTRLVINRQFVV